MGIIEAIILPISHLIKQGELLNDVDAVGDRSRCSRTLLLSGWVTVLTLCSPGSITSINMQRSQIHVLDKLIFFAISRFL